jgi:hypothetical protein
VGETHQSLAGHSKNLPANIHHTWQADSGMWTSDTERTRRRHARDEEQMWWWQATWQRWWWGGNGLAKGEHALDDTRLQRWRWRVVGALLLLLCIQTVCVRWGENSLASFTAQQHALKRCSRVASNWNRVPSTHLPNVRWYLEPTEPALPGTHWGKGSLL